MYLEWIRRLEFPLLILLEIYSLTIEHMWASLTLTIGWYLHYLIGLYNINEGADEMWCIMDNIALNLCRGGLQ
jgi:hypothetical protein